jgi:hypothetical protein
MTFMGNAPLANENYSIATGSNSTGPFIPVFMTRNPTPNDVNYQVKQTWINTLSGSEWILLGFNATNGVTTANWLSLSFNYNVAFWTPMLSFGGSAANITYLTQAGRYTQIANLVFLQYYIRLSSIAGAGAGQATITNIPINATTIPATGVPQAIGVFSNINLDSGFSTLGAVVRASAPDYIELDESGSGQLFQFLMNSNFTNSSYIQGGLWYFSS